MSTIRVLLVMSRERRPPLFEQLEAFGIEVVPMCNCAEADRKSTRLNSSHIQKSRMPSSA